MSLLVDTHVFIWWASGQRDLSPQAARALGDPGRPVFISAASAWEASIKVAAGKLTLGEISFSKAVEMGHFRSLPVTIGHAEAAADLPLHHKDPFDRMLIAQARLEGLTLVTHDRVFDAYDVPLIRT